MDDLEKYHTYLTIMNYYVISHDTHIHTYIHSSFCDGRSCVLEIIFNDLCIYDDLLKLINRYLSY